jgi:NAD(P)-dependent dehydrogenase (short-subunit alcohol dehydrogenase family)
MTTAYITGADRGLGLGLATVFLEAGYHVFAGCYGLDETGLLSLKSRYGEHLDIVPLDVSREDSVAAAATYLSERTDRLDLLINNAAILLDKDATIEDGLRFDDMLAMYNVNALGPLRVAASVLPLLKRGEGRRIVNISSEAGSMAARVRRGQRTRYGYCASKSALNVQSILLQNHVSDYGIRVWLIEPGWVRSYLAGGPKCTLAPTEPEESARRLLAFLGREGAPSYLFHGLFEDARFDW